MIQRAFGPRLRTRGAGGGNGVELPDQRAVLGAEGAYRAGEGVRPLGGGKAHDELVFKDDARHRDAETARAIHRRREVQPTAFPEAGHQLPIRGVEGDEFAPRGEEHPPVPLVAGVLPPHQAALRRARQIEVRAPKLRAGGRVQREGRQRWRQPVEHAIHHQGARVHAAGRPAGVVHPSALKTADVGAVDLRQRGVVRTPRVTKIGAPVHVARRRFRPLRAQRGRCASRQRQTGGNQTSEAQTAPCNGQSDP